MGLDPESRAFLSGMDEIAKGYNPEVSRLVDELRFQQLGKPIVYLATPPLQHLQQQAVSSLEKLAGIPQTDSKGIQVHNEELIGYILPVNPEQSRHLVIFKDGTMLVIEPRNTININIYKNYFYPSEAPFQKDRITSIPQIVSNLSSIANPFDCHVLYRNDNPADEAQIDAAREQAVQVAFQLKEQRDRTKKATTRRLIDSFQAFLFPPKPTEGPN